MKDIYFIGGPMGVGKTTVCQILKRKVRNNVYLDGDWCWDSNPFIVNGETKEMVIKNITYLLNRFIACTEYTSIFFSWVLDEQTIIEDILNRLQIENCILHSISLICEPSELSNRLQKDIEIGLREESVVKRSIERLPKFQELDTVKIDVTHLTPQEVADYILKFC